MDALTDYLLRSGGLLRTTSHSMPKHAELPPPGMGNTLDESMASLDPEAHLPPDMEVPGSKRALEQLAMWRAWKQSGYAPQYLRPLQASLALDVRHHVNKWKAANVSTDLLMARAQQLMLEALKDYDPNRTVNGRARSIRSHVHERLARLQRFVVENQNAGRIQESRAGKNMRIFQEAVAVLTAEFGREPTAKEVAERMSLQMGKPVTTKQVETYMREQRKDRNVSDENFSFMPTDTRILLKLLPEELTPLENQVFERYYGLNGSRKMKPGEIAADLQLSAPRVSRLLNSISEKAQQYL